MKTLHRTVLTAFAALVATLIATVAIFATPCLAWADSGSGTGSGTLTYTENGVSKTETFQNPRDLINRAKAVQGDVVIELLEDWDTRTFRINVPSGRNYTINMNGHMINRNLATNDDYDGGYTDYGGGFALSDNSTLTINGGDTTVAHGGSTEKGSSGINQQWHYTGTDGAETIYGGLITGGAAHEDGGGICVSGDNAKLYLNDVTIAGNTCGDTQIRSVYGGGIAVTGDDVELSLNNTSVKWNYTQHNGGGIYLSGDDCKAQIKNCDISSNRTKTGNGAGIYLNKQIDLTIENSKINNNIAGSCDDVFKDSSGSGGGIYVNRGKSTVTLVQTQVNANFAGVRGGAFFIDGQACTINLDGSQANNNHTGYSRSWSKAEGGGFYINGRNSTVNLTNGSSIDGNIAGQEENGPNYGGGIYVYSKNVNINVTNSSVSSNKANGSGGGIYVDPMNGTGARVIFKDSKLNKNLSVGDSVGHAGEGGGLYIKAGGLYVFDNSEVSENFAQRNGGAFLLCNDDITLVLQNGTQVTNNSCGTQDSASFDYSGLGGGMYASGDGLKIKMNDATIQGNVANKTKDAQGNDNHTSGMGGGIYAESGVSITSNGRNGVITQNTAEGNGGGLWFSEEMTLEGIECTNNKSAGVGGGIYCDNSTYYTFVLNDYVNITQNYSADGATLDNLYMKGEQDVCGGTGANALSEQSKIGVTVDNYSGGTSKRRITGNQATLTNIGDNYNICFSSDNSNYYVLRDGNYLYLADKNSVEHQVTVEVGNWNWQSEASNGKEIVLDTSAYLTYEEQDESTWGKLPDGSIVSRVNEWTYLDSQNTIDYWTVREGGYVVDTIYPSDGKATYTMGHEDVVITAHVLRPVGSATVELDESNTTWDSLKSDAYSNANSVSLRDRFFTLYPNGYSPADGYSATCVIDKAEAQQATAVSRKWISDDTDGRTVEYTVNLKGSSLAEHNLYGNYQSFVTKEGEQPNPFQQLDITLPSWADSYDIVETHVESLSDYSEYLVYKVTYHKIPTVQVNFNADGGTVSETSREVQINTAMGSLPVPTRTGYLFDGWYNGTTRVTADSTFASDVTLTAQWREQTQEIHTVSFVDDDDVLDVKSVVHGEPVVASASPVQEGYSFESWQVDGVDYDFTQPVTSDLTLDVQWTANVYTVSFDLNGGEGTCESQPVSFGNCASAPTAPTKEDYNFVSWQLNGVDYDFSQPVTSNIELTATWEKSTHTAYFVSEGKVVATQVFATGEPVEVPTIDARDGYVLSGWYTDEALTRRFDFSNCSMTSDIVLYANWEEMFTITFDSAGGESVDVRYTRPGLTLGALPHPVRDHYSLVGWFDKDGNKYTEDTIIEKSVTLTAQWESDQVRIYYFDGDDTLDIQSVPFGSAVTELMTPSKEGYTFLGWYLDEELTQPFVYGEEVTESIGVYAKWEQTHPVTPDDPDNPDNPDGSDDPDNAGDPDVSGNPDNEGGLDDTGSKGNSGANALASTGDSTLLVSVASAGVLLGGCALVVMALLLRRERW